MRQSHNASRFVERSVSGSRAMTAPGTRFHAQWPAQPRVPPLSDLTKR